MASMTGRWIGRAASSLSAALLLGSHERRDPPADAQTGLGDPSGIGGPDLDRSAVADGGRVPRDPRARPPEVVRRPVDLHDQVVAGPGRGPGESNRAVSEEDGESSTFPVRMRAAWTANTPEV
jgi:hypothetical protein